MIALAPHGPLFRITPTGTNFYMNGLGYTHPTWGHGRDHGELETAYDVSPALMTPLQAICTFRRWRKRRWKTAASASKDLACSNNYCRAACAERSHLDPGSRAVSVPTGPDAFTTDWLAAALKAPRGSLQRFSATNPSAPGR